MPRLPNSTQSSSVTDADGVRYEKRKRYTTQHLSVELGLGPIKWASGRVPDGGVAPEGHHDAGLAGLVRRLLLAG